MTTITHMPILIAPEKLGKAELVEKCREQQQTMILQDRTIQMQSSKLAEVCGIANRLGTQLEELAGFFDSNDMTMIYMRLKTLSERRKSYKKTEVR